MKELNTVIRARLPWSPDAEPFLFAEVCDGDANKIHQALRACKIER